MFYKNKRNNRKYNKRIRESSWLTKPVVDKEKVKEIYEECLNILCQLSKTNNYGKKVKLYSSMLDTINTKLPCFVDPEKVYDILETYSILEKRENIEKFILSDAAISNVLSSIYEYACNCDLYRHDDGLSYVNIKYKINQLYSVVTYLRNKAMAKIPDNKSMYHNEV